MELVLFIAVGVLLAVVLLAAVTHVLGFSDRLTGSLRASTTEAGERTSDWAAEFWRWLRTGR